jgi:hypothetical protein
MAVLVWTDGQAQKQTKLRARELLVYFGTGGYDFGTRIPNLSAILTGSGKEPAPRSRPSTLTRQPRCSVPQQSFEHPVQPAKGSQAAEG